MKRTLLSLALIGFSSIAAAHSTVYTTGSLGAGGISSDNANVGAQFAMGTNALVPNVGFEIGFRGTAAGNVSDEEKQTANDYLGGTSSLILAAKPYYDAGPFQFWGKLGFNSWDAEYKHGAMDPDSDVMEKATGLDIMYGLGMDVFMGNNFAIGVSYENYNFKDISADSINLNFSLHFS